jgi:hypothetical protein
MTTSSPQDSFSTVLTNSLVEDIEGIVTSSVDNSITINLNTLQIDTSNYEINWNWQQEEWIDSFPDWNRIQAMCKKYPGLEIALRNFQTVYTLVKDDYDNPKDNS